MKPVLYLWDLDGTILKTTAGRRAIRRVYRDRHGIPACDEGIMFAGGTDQVIFRQIHTQHGIRAPDPGEMMQAYLEYLAAEIASDPGELFPGVPGVLAALVAHPQARLALGTGNIEAAARMKLAAHGLLDYFPTGGYGSDAADRPAIIAAGIRRSRRHYQTDFEAVVVIGDTPADVACGRANGARTVAVAQFRYGAPELMEAGADAVIPNFADVTGAVGVLLGAGGLTA